MGTTHQRSKALWIGGGVVGGIIGWAASQGLPPERSTLKTTALSAVLGSILLGGIGDAVLEQEQRTGVFSLLPLRWRGLPSGS